MPDVKGDDTIVAIATASGEAALSIVRLSGPEAFQISDTIFRAQSKKLIRDSDPFSILYGHIVDHDVVIDECLAGIFKKPKSFTAEDMVEFSTHGGSQVAEKVLRLCVSRGARMAEPGEFTKRAFLNGRIDLTQAEAVVDVIHASSEQSLRQAMHQLEGRLSKEINKIKERLLKVLAHVEAYVDFPEEDHDVFSNEEFGIYFRELRQELEALGATFKSGKLVRSGLLCVLVGKPNVGKSSLLNVLLGEDRAIVTNIPGTTRDTLEEGFVWQGVTVRLVDTAGLGQPKDELERLGMERTRRYFEHADLFIWVLDGSSRIEKEDLEIADSICSKPLLIVVNKSDLASRIQMDVVESRANDALMISCSAVRGDGVEEIKNAIVKIFLGGALSGENVRLTRERHRAAVEEAATSLRRAEEAYEKKISLEFIASDLRAALRALGEITGEIYTDDVLDVIFREFCVGK